MLPWLIFGMIEMPRQNPSQDIIDQGRFATAGRPRDTSEAAERKRRRDILEIMLGRVVDR